ncbi:MAG: HPr family phosphocarrier protein [Agathobacter sp.]|nr:HPr family phosphocarrier protein [Agathobacter sp.]
MVSQTVKITNPTGLDVKPAGILCKEAMKFKCKITYGYGGGNTANAKSVLSVLGSSIKHGEDIQLMCEGEDEEAALAHLVACFEAGLED